jgi:RNA polymerase sigma-70 factor (ECF subfamily)
MAELADEEADTASFAEMRLSAEDIARGFAMLDPKYRDALVLRFFEERSYAEMSDILEMPIGTVSTLLHRAKRALKDALPHRLMK